MRYALINPAGLVVNVVIAEADWTPVDGLTARELADGQAVGPGWTWDGTTFTPPTPGPDVPTLSDQTAARNAAAQLVVADRIAADTLTYEESVAVAAIFPTWQPDEAVTVGDLRYYDGHLVECLQTHTTQADWTPPVVPALWRIWRDPNAVSEWVQPAGSTDAYPKGAKVTHNGKTWESLVDANVWQPPTQWAEVTA